MQQRTIAVCLGALSLVALAAAGRVEGTPRFAVVTSRTPDTTRTTDPIARLQARLSTGDVVLEHDSTLGYLPALLRVLDIPVSSQGLVFSRTSLQTDRITPWSPRALYFNDDVYVGYVLDSDILEIASVDATDGVRFYTLSQHEKKRPTFAREGSTCLMCHQSRATGNVAGLMVRSTIADRHGYPITGAHDGTTTDETPIRARFGGWYVTGTHGSTGHSGNVHSPMLSHEITDKAAYRDAIDLTRESARTDLTGRFDATTYLSAHSDIVALMVLVHQTTVHNLMVVVDDLAQTADSTSLRLTTAVDHLVRAMLFAHEAPLDGPMRGTTPFVAEFSARGPRDRQGRSLRDFDLEKRLFRYPLSFLVYSASFDSLPDVARNAVYGRLQHVLDAAVVPPNYARLTKQDRVAIREILVATKPGFKAWVEASRGRGKHAGQ